MRARGQAEIGAELAAADQRPGKDLTGQNRSTGAADTLEGAQQLPLALHLCDLGVGGVTLEFNGTELFLDKVETQVLTHVQASGATGRKVACPRR